MKIKPTLRNFILATFCASSVSLQAATIQLDLTSNNAGAISLDSGDNTFSYTGFSVDYLIVGGGGGGGGGTTHNSNAGGGGGAGGLREGSTSIGGLQNIVVGGGGAGGNNNRGASGQNSTALGFTALGGGGGGYYAGSGLDGGSGGGAGARGSFTAGFPENDGGLAVGGAGSLGNSGGSRLNTNQSASGGGGAGGAGADGGGTSAGGAAVTRNITGTDVMYAGGGGGGRNSGSAGASDTGGTGGVAGSVAASTGTANTGGGGGGAGTAATTGAAGGSGIVVIRYSGPQVLAGGLVSTVGGDTVHQFTTTGSSTLDLHSATIAGDISGDGNLVWDKTGTLTLSGNNTYTGSTTVSSGSLIITGSITSALTVGDNTTIGGGGTVGSISFAGGSLFDMFKAVADSDSLAATAISFAAEGFGIESLRYDGSAVNWASIASNTYTLITGTLDSTNLGNFGVDNAFIIGDGRHAYFKDGSLQLVVENIPEPTTALFGGLGFLMLLRRRR
jgi:hypothetical protein